MGPEKVININNTPFQNLGILRLEEGLFLSFEQVEQTEETDELRSDNQTAYDSQITRINTNCNVGRARANDQLNKCIYTSVTLIAFAVFFAMGHKFLPLNREVLLLSSVSSGVLVVFPIAIGIERRSEKKRLFEVKEIELRQVREAHKEGIQLLDDAIVEIEAPTAVALNQLATFINNCAETRRRVICETFNDQQNEKVNKCLSNGNVVGVVGDDTNEYVSAQLGLLKEKLDISICEFTDFGKEFRKPQADRVNGIMPDAYGIKHITSMTQELNAKIVHGTLICPLRSQQGKAAWQKCVEACKHYNNVIPPLPTWYRRDPNLNGTKAQNFIFVRDPNLPVQAYTGIRVIQSATGNAGTLTAAPGTPRPLPPPPPPLGAPPPKPTGSYPTGEGVDLHYV